MSRHKIDKGLSIAGVQEMLRGDIKSEKKIKKGFYSYFRFKTKKTNAIKRTHRSIEIEANNIFPRQQKVTREFISK